MSKENIKSVLDTLDWYDISIQKNSIGELVLILVCREVFQADSLYLLLQNTEYSIRGFAKSNDEKYVVRIYFEYNIILHCTTTRTIDTYPSILWLENMQIPLITAGTFVGYNESDIAVYNYNSTVSFKNNINLN